MDVAYAPGMGSPLALWTKTSDRSGWVGWSKRSAGNKTCWRIWQHIYAGYNWAPLRFDQRPVGKTGYFVSGTLHEIHLHLPLALRLHFAAGGAGKCGALQLSGHLIVVKVDPVGRRYTVFANHRVLH